MTIDFIYQTDFLFATFQFLKKPDSNKKLNTQQQSSIGKRLNLGLSCKLKIGKYNRLYNL